MVEIQGHRSKVKVTVSKMLFASILQSVVCIFLDNDKCLFIVGLLPPTLVEEVMFSVPSVRLSVCLCALYQLNHWTYGPESWHILLLTFTFIISRTSSKVRVVGQGHRCQKY